jgi:hypothetical protein
MPYNKNMNKTNTKTEYQVVRNFFNDAQWDVIDMALNEFQDHDDYQEFLILSVANYRMYLITQSINLIL